MKVVKDTINAFLADDCPRMAAALSYYTVFSLPGLLLIVLVTAGLLVDPVMLQQQLLGEVGALIGPEAARQVGGMLADMEQPGGGHPLVVVASVGALLFAATGAFAQLQGALNRAWQVEPDPDRGGVKNFLIKRVLSFGMILGVALLLLLSLLTQTLLTAFGGLIEAVLPEPLSVVMVRAVSYSVSLAFATILFALVFQVIPDAVVRWHDAWRGALATAILFLIGNVLLGLYLGRAGAPTAFGAAGSLALILIWIYYSSMIFFLGAELTQALAHHRGEPIRPSRGAIRVVLERRTLPEEESV